MIIANVHANIYLFNNSPKILKVRKKSEGMTSHLHDILNKVTIANVHAYN